MDFKEEIVQFMTDKVGGITIVAEGSAEIVYADSYFREKYGDAVVGMDAEEIFVWNDDCPALEIDGDAVEWEYIDTNTKKYFKFNSGLFQKEGKNYKISCYEGCYLALDSYNIEKDYIITVKDNKYGIEKINSDEVLLDNLYEDVSWSDWAAFFDNDKTDNDGEKYYIEKNYVKIKENNKWYLYDLNNKKKVINTGYEELILIDDNIILVYDNKEIYFINYEGNKIDDNVIKTNGISPAFAKPTFKEKFNMYLKDNVLDFKICDGEVEFWSDCYSKNLIKEYKYDIKNKKVELVK